MLGLCKCCMGFFDKDKSADQDLEEEKVGLADEGDGDKKPATAIVIKKQSASTIGDVEVVANADAEPDPDDEANIPEAKRKLSDHFEEDSGTCVENSAENMAVSNEKLADDGGFDLYDYLDHNDRVQLTVSSVNSILPDLPEEEDDEEPTSGDNVVIETQPLITNGVNGVSHDSQDVKVIKPVVRSVPMVVSCQIKSEAKTTSGSGSARPQLTSVLKKGNLKPTTYARQSSVPASSSVSSLKVTTTTSSSGSSSRRNSGDQAHALIVTQSSSVGGGVDPVGGAGTDGSSGSISQAKKERSPCVSFDKDVTVVEPIRPRSRSDAGFSSSARLFRGKLAFLRDRREQHNLQSKMTVKANPDGSVAMTSTFPLAPEAGVSSEADKVVRSTEGFLNTTSTTTTTTATPSTSSIRPRTRSDSKWIKIRRKRKAAAVAEAAKSTAFDWPLGRLGKLRQKYTGTGVPIDEPANPVGGGIDEEVKNNNKPVERSQSVAGLTNHEVEVLQERKSRLKRAGSERGGKKSVNFERGGPGGGGGGPLNWWNASMKFLFDKKKSRRRHLSADSSKKLFAGSVSQKFLLGSLL